MVTISLHLTTLPCAPEISFRKLSGHVGARCLKGLRDKEPIPRLLVNFLLNPSVV